MLAPPCRTGSSTGRIALQFRSKSFVLMRMHHCLALPELSTPVLSCVYITASQKQGGGTPHFADSVARGRSPELAKLPVLKLMRTLLHSSKLQAQCFHTLAHSLHKNMGGGGQNDRAALAQKRCRWLTLYNAARIGEAVSRGFHVP